jgi:hypothetical protein
VTRPPEPEVVAATLRAFLDSAGAQRAAALLDRDAPALVECEAGGAATVAEGDEQRPLLAAAETLPLPHLHSFPPIDVDAGRAQLTAPPGAVAHLAGAVRELSNHLGGRSVLTVEWTTTDPEAPFTVAARTGEPLVVALGDETFEMPLGWP